MHNDETNLQDLKMLIGERTKINKFDIDKKLIIARAYQLWDISTLPLFKNG